jgi:hypothetical protein
MNEPNPKPERTEIAIRNAPGAITPSAALTHAADPGHLDRVAAQPVDPIPADRAMAIWCSIADSLDLIAHHLARIANHVDPPPDAIVGTPYIAKRLGCTTVWVGEMTRDGLIPKTCIVTGTGNGKPWKFHRQQIDQWIASR